MNRYLVNLKSTADRNRALRIVGAAPFGTRVEVKAIKRSLPQNDRMWAMLTEIAQQLPWCGRKRTPDDWKLLFLDALKRELEIVESLDGTGSVALRGDSSSDLSKGEMSDMIELMFEFGARHDVKFQDDAKVA